MCVLQNLGVICQTEKHTLIREIKASPLILWEVMAISRKKLNTDLESAMWRASEDATHRQIWGQCCVLSASISRVTRRVFLPEVQTPGFLLKHHKQSPLVTQTAYFTPELELTVEPSGLELSCHYPSCERYFQDANNSIQKVLLFCHPWSHIFRCHMPCILLLRKLWVDLCQELNVRNLPFVCYCS